MRAKRRQEWRTKMTILGLETSCDETSASVIETDDKNRIQLLSNVTSSSLPLHSKTGGIIPEVAAREQVKFIIPVIEKALSDANLSEKEIDAIAVTFGPGLIGSLLVGVETAKTLSWIWNKPLIPVNHLFGHIYANFIENPNIKFPAIALVVSGGHTDLVLIKAHGKIKWLGGTRDDAAGEAYDKIGRLINLPYPAGPIIEELAKKGNPKAFNFPRPMIGTADFDFSFSGLKASVAREVIKLNRGVARPEGVPLSARNVRSGSEDIKWDEEATGPQIGKLSEKIIADICASTQEAIIGVLIRKTLKAVKKYKVKSLLLGGGVASNQKLRDELKKEIEKNELETELVVPSKELCTDNGAMIAAAAVFNYKPVEWKKVTANPELYFD